MKKNGLSFLRSGSLILLALFLLAACQAVEKEVAAAQTGSTGIVYAMDLADRKLFNAAEPAPELETEKVVAQTPSTGIVYAIDPVDGKLFNAAEPAPRKVDSEAAAEALIFRWQAMKFFADHGMMNE